MNGKKKKNEKQVLDSGKVNPFLQLSLTSNHFNMNRFLNLKFNIYDLNYLKGIKKE